MSRGRAPGAEAQAHLLLPVPRVCTLTTAQSGGEQLGASQSGTSWPGVTDPRVEQRLSELLPQGVGRHLTLEIDRRGAAHPQLGVDESYRLEFDSSSITLRAPESWGALHGLATLWQLRAGHAMPLAGMIEDRPRFPWRGVLIDVARHFMPVDLLYRVVDGMARLKMNVLHLHLSDDQAFRFPSQAYPRLASDPSYTADELRGLIEFAARVGVRVVPELDVPGHVNCWLERYPQWGSEAVAASSKFGVHQACLNVVDEAVYEALRSLFAEVAALFPDRYVHIGGDEVHPAWWSKDEAVQAYMQAHRLADAAALQTHFNRRMCAMLTPMGKQVVAWDEVLHQEMPDLLVQNWRGATTRDRALAAGRDCLVSAGYYLDLFYPAETYYGFDPQARQNDLLAYEDGLRRDIRFEHIAAGLSWTDHWRDAAIDLDSHRGARGRVLGGEACLWSELVAADTLEVRLWSRLPAVAERLWSPVEVDDVEDFYRRLRRTLQLPVFAVEERQQSSLRNLGLSDWQISMAAYLEPVKWYARLLGEQALQARLQGSEMPQARPYDCNTPLNRLVDYLSPESLAARQLTELEQPQLMMLAHQWRHLDEQSWPQDVGEAIAGLREVGIVLADLLDAVPQTLPAERYTRSVTALRDIYQPRGEYMVAVVPWLLVWLDTWYRGGR